MICSELVFNLHLLPLLDFQGFQIVIKCLCLLFIDVKPQGMGSMIVLIDLSCMPDFAREVPEESYYRVILLSSLEWAVTH